MCVDLSNRKDEKVVYTPRHKRKNPYLEQNMFDYAHRQVFDIHKMAQIGYCLQFVCAKHSFSCGVEYRLGIQ